MARVAVILGRGIEGCGVTRYAVQQHRWLNRQSIEHRVFYMRDKHYARSAAHDTADFVGVKFDDPAQVESMRHYCDDCTYVVINSLPPKENAHTSPISDRAYENWDRFVETCLAPIALVQHDHKVYSLRRNHGMDEAIGAAAIVFVHSMTNDMAAHVRKLAQEKLFSVDDRPAPVLAEFQPGVTMDTSDWVSVQDQDPHHHKWIGRSTSWKGYDLMFKFSEHLVKADPLSIVTLEGIDKSPGFLAIKGQYEFNSHVGSNMDRVAQVDLEPYRGKGPVLFSQFTCDAMVKRMARTGFGYQTSVLEPRFIHHNLESSHCDVVRSGAVPVFRTEYGDACVHRVTGDPLTRSADSGTVWLDYDGQSFCAELIAGLIDSSTLRDEWRHRALEFYGSHQDADAPTTFLAMHRDIMEAVPH